MFKGIIVAVFLLTGLCYTSVKAQSFCVETGIRSKNPNCFFSDDAIYFYGNDTLIKTDYIGNVRWACSGIPLERIEVQGSDIFASSANNIIRMDTSGTVIWTKNLSGQTIADLFSDDKYLYVSQYSGLPHAYNFRIVTLDSLGTVVNCFGSQSQLQSRPSIGSDALSGGGFLTFLDFAGQNYDSWIEKIDSSGNHVFSSAWIGGQNVLPLDIVSSADSTYLAVFNIIGPQYNAIAMVKLEEDGTMHWSKRYKFMNDQILAVGVTSDSLNNIYLLGNCYVNNSQRHFISVFDSGGNMVSSNSWSYNSGEFLFYDPNTIISVGDNFFYQNRIHWKNNKLYCLGMSQDSSAQPCIMVFDLTGTSPGNLCYDPDTLISLTDETDPLTGPNPLSPLSSVLLNTFSYSVSPVVLPNAGVYNICFASNVGDPELEIAASLYPNPATDNVLLTYHSALAKTSTVRIYDIKGTLVHSSKIEMDKGMNKTSLDISSLEAGVYVVYLDDEYRSLKKRLVIN